jgi:hypothetical protein
MIGELTMLLQLRIANLAIRELKEKLANSQYLSGALQRQVHKANADYRSLSNSYNDLSYRHDQCAENQRLVVKAYTDRIAVLEERANRADDAYHELAEKIRALLPGGELLPCSCSVCREHRTPEEDPDYRDRCNFVADEEDYYPEPSCDCEHDTCPKGLCYYSPPKPAQEAPSSKRPADSSPWGWPHNSGDTYCGLCFQYGCPRHP